MSSEGRIVGASKTSVISPVSLRKLSFGKVGRKQSNGSVQGATAASPTSSSRSLESADSGRCQRQPSKSRVRRHHHRLSAVFSRSFSTLGRGGHGSSGGGYYYGMASDGGGGGGGGGGGEDGGAHLVADDPAELSNQVTAPGILKIFGNEICEGANYKSVLATTQSSAKELVKEALERYSLDKADADAYVLCDVIGCITDHVWRSECLRVVGDNEKPLLLQSMWKPREGHSRRFEIQRRATVEEKTGREKDTITAGINAQARKLQKTRSRGKAIFMEMTRRRSQNEGHGGLGSSFGGLFRSRSEADIVVEEEPPSSSATDTESQSQGSPVKSAGNRSQSHGSPAKRSSSRSQSPVKSTSSRSHSPVKSASSSSISVGGRSHSSPVKRANKDQCSPVKSASSGAIASPGFEAPSASPKKGGDRRGSFWVGDGSGLRSRPGSQSGSGGGTASEAHKDAQCPAPEREEGGKESSDVVSSGSSSSSSRASQYSIHPPLHFPYFLLLHGYNPSQDFIIYPITGERTVFGCGGQLQPNERGQENSPPPPAVDVSLWAPDVNPQHCAVERLQPADLSPPPIRVGQDRGSTGIRSTATNSNTNSSTTTNGNATSPTNSNLSTSTNGSPTTTTTRSSSINTNHSTTTNCNSNHHCSSTNGDAPSTYTNGDATSTSLSPVTNDYSSSSSSTTTTIIATRSTTTRTLLKPFPGALVKRNGVCVTRETFLRNGDLVGLGDYYLLMFKDPAATASEGVAPYAKLMPALHACAEGVAGGGGVATAPASAPLSPTATEPLCNTCMSSSSSATVVPTSPWKSGDMMATTSSLPRLRGGDGEELSLVYELGQEELVVREIFSFAGEVAAGHGGDGHGGGDDQPKLMAALLLSLCLQRSAAHFSTTSLRKLLLGIASDVQTMVWQSAKDLAADQPEMNSSSNQDLQEPQLLTISKLIPGLQPMVLWMANSIELLHFIQHELPLLLHGLATNGDLEEHGAEEEEEEEEHIALLEMRMAAVRPASEEAMTVLEEVIMFTFQQCVYYITKVLYPLLPSVLDSHPFSESGQVVVQEEISSVLEVLQRALQLLRDFQVHWDIGSQLIAYLFFFINAFLFNLLMERGSGGSFYQWSRGVQIRANLDLLMDWAHGVELGDLAQACLNKLSTAVNLIATPKEHLLQDSWGSLRVEFSQLNAAQLHHMLREYSSSRRGPPAWTPPSTDAPAAHTTGDILESLDNHPPLVLPCTGFLLELGRPITDTQLSTQLHRLQQFINALPHTADGAEMDANPATAKDTVVAVPLEAKVTKMESLPRAQLEVGQAEKVLPHHHGDNDFSLITTAMTTTTTTATMTTATTPTMGTTNSNSAIIRTRTDLAAYASLLNQRLSSLEKQSAEGAIIGRTSSSGSSSSGGSASSGGSGASSRASGGSGGSGSSGSEGLAFYPARSHCSHAPHGPHGPPSAPSSPKLRQLVLAEVEAEIEPHLRQMVLAEIEAEIPSSPQLRQMVLAEIEAEMPSSPRLRQMVLGKVEAEFEPPTSPRLRQMVLAKVEAELEPPTSPLLRQMVLAKVEDEFEPQFSPRLRKLVLAEVEADGLLDESDTETEAEDPRRGEENGPRGQKADYNLNHNHRLVTHIRDAKEVLEEEEEEEQEEREEEEEEGDGDVGDEDDGDVEEEEEEERDVFAVELQRGLCGLGLALETPMDLEGIYIRSILPGSPAAMSQRLCPGDRIMAVNGVSLVGMDYHGGRELIQKCGEKPRFLVSRSMWGGRGRSGLPNESTS